MPTDADTSPVLVVGAAGSFASLVIPELARRGIASRGLVRHDEQTEQVLGLGASEVVVGDLNDPESLQRALADMNRAFYIAPAFMKDEAEVGTRFVNMAQSAGVERIVFSSVVHPVLSSLINHAAKAPVEAAILTSGMEYTFLHPVLFFQMFEGSWSRTLSSGILAEPWSTDTKFARVDYREIAEATAIAFSDDRLLNGTFELSSAGSTNRHDVAALITEVTGKQIEAQRVDPDRLASVPPPMRKMFEHYDHNGLLANSLTLEAILDRAPKTLRDYFAELHAEQPTN